MPKRLSHLDKQRLDLSAIVKRLPLHRQLGESQTALIELTPIWQTFIRQHLPNWVIDSAVPNNDLAISAELTSYGDHRLTISCSSSIYASQLKHLQTSLLSTLKAGFPAIQSIHIQIKQPKNNNLTSHCDDKASSGAAQQNTTSCLSAQAMIERSVSSNTIQSIEHCQKHIANEKLANSLSKLANTLKNKE